MKYQRLNNLKSEEQINIKEWNKYFSLEEIMRFRTMENIENKHIEHPMWYLISSKERNYFNTKSSFDIIYNNDKKYLDKIINKIIQEKNFSNINGMLGEIRCYGYLLNSLKNNNNITLEPITTEKDNQTSDFEIYNKKYNEKVYIEVNTKQCNDKESKNLVELRNKFDKEIKEKEKIDYTNRNELLIQMATTCFAPFGRSKDHINIDVIQKIAQIKSNKHQIPEDSIGILWIDFQSEGINRMIEVEQAEPLYYCWNYGMFSGVLWYALYGKKELPIFNSNQFNFAYERFSKFDYMQHDGLFIQRADIAAVVVSESRYTIIFENPFSKKQIPIWFLEDIITMPNFKYEHSRIQFPKYDIKQEIENEYKKIEDLSKIPNIKI